MSDENAESHAAELLLESIEIRRVIRPDGADMVVLETADSSGGPMGLIEAMQLLEFSRIQLMAEFIRLELIGDEDHDDDEEEC